MSTWLTDLDKTHPELATAFRVVGNEDRHSLRNMVKALSMCTALNTPEDEKRLAAAQYILRNNRPVK